MEHVLRGLVGHCCLVYLDDIIIFSPDAETHVQHLRKVFDALRTHELVCSKKKCVFDASSLHYLGHVVTDKGVTVDPDKVSIVREWPQPKTLQELRSFLGLAQYFRKFIQGFAAQVLPLTNLTRAGKFVSEWDPQCTAAFQGLKRDLTTAPVLRLPDWDKPFELISDASDFACGVVLLQEGHPVAYCSRKFQGAELNYNVTDKELFGVIYAVMNLGLFPPLGCHRCVLPP